jgi:t-SNARE complex subunit (syntaxin)
MEQRELENIVLDDMDTRLENLKTISQDIGNELDEHKVILEKIDTDMDNTDEKMVFGMNKIKKLLNSKSSWYKMGIIIAMCIVIVILFMLIIFS